MKKYYLMAINQGSGVAMFNYGLYCESIKDYNNMIKYYLMATEKNYHHATYSLANYYYRNDDFINVEKYHLIAVEKGYRKSIDTLRNCYSNFLYHDKLLDFLGKYEPNRLIEYLNFVDISKLTYLKRFMEIILSISPNEIYKTTKTIQLIYNLAKQKIDLLEIHFKYLPDNDGFIQAKNDYLSRVST